MTEPKLNPYLAVAEYLGVDYDTAKALIHEAMATPRGAHEHEECAEDLRVGMQFMGLSSVGNPRMKTVLASGGAVTLHCPTCHAHGQGHLLKIRMFGDQFFVRPVGVA